MFPDGWDSASCFFPGPHVAQINDKSVPVVSKTIRAEPFEVPGCLVSIFAILNVPSS